MPLCCCCFVTEVLDGFFELETAEAMADIYVWLRYSATRQLTWQRNYNTQPRILSAAQVRAVTPLASMQLALETQALTLLARSPSPHC